MQEWKVALRVGTCEKIGCFCSKGLELVQERIPEEDPCTLSEINGVKTEFVKKSI